MYTKLSAKTETIPKDVCRGQEYTIRFIKAQQKLETKLVDGINI